MKEVKTLDGVAIEQERIECVAMILSNCSQRRLELLGVHDRFVDYAERFIMFLTEEELKEFIAHHVCIELLNSI